MAKLTIDHGEETEVSMFFIPEAEFDKIVDMYCLEEKQVKSTVWATMQIATLELIFFKKES